MKRKIPTIAGLFLTLVLVVGLAFTVSQAEKVTKLFSRAEQKSALLLIGTGNITDSGFSVYWLTDGEAAGKVYWGKTTSFHDGVAIDERDLVTPNGKYLTHFVHVVNLTPNTKYYFKVGSTNALYGDSTKGDAPFELITGVKLTATPVIDPVFGKILDNTGAPGSGVIAIWETSGASKIVALSKSDGTFVLPVATARNEDLSDFFDFSKLQSEIITLDSGTNGRSVITCKASLDRPLPTAKLGEDINCSQPKQGSFGFKPPTGGVASTGGQLRTNISEGQTVSTPLPTISGGAGPNQDIKIEVHSDATYSGTIRADPSGNWSWTPPANLSPGQHSVTITVQNADGTTQVITRSFYVSSGETILPITSGTPSATPTHRSCKNNSCMAVAGEGVDSCTTDSDCQPAPPPVTPPPPVLPPPPVATPPATPITGRTENTILLLTLGVISVILGVGILHKT